MAGNIYMDASNGAGDMDYAVNPYAMAKGLERLNANLVVTNLITNYSQEARSQGTRMSANVRVPLRGALSAATKTPGTAATYQQAATTKADIAISTHQTVDFLVEDYGGLFDPSTIEGYMVDAGSTLAEAIENAVIGLYASAGATKGTATAGVDMALLGTLQKDAMEAKWRGNEASYLIVGPEGYYDLWNLAQLTQYSIEGGDQSMFRNGFIGNLGGFQVFKSNLIPAVAGSPTGEHCMAFQREAMGIAFVDMSTSGLPAGYGTGVQIQPMNKEDDNGNLIYSMRSIVGYSQTERGMSVSVDSIYGVGVVRNALLFDVLV
jgi:hypothetical protein